MISLSLLPTAHPSFLQQTTVRASSICYDGFTLAMGRSPRFGSILCNSTPYSDSLSLRLRLVNLTLLHRITRRLIKQKARDQAFPVPGSFASLRTSAGHSPLAACRYTVSGSLSLPSPGFFSPFPHGTGSLSVIREYLALEGGPPGFPQGFSSPVVLRTCIQRANVLSPTGLSPSLVGLSSPFR